MNGYKKKDLTTWGRLWRKFLVFLACAIVFNAARYATLKLPLSTAATIESVNAAHATAKSIESIPSNLVFGAIGGAEKIVQQVKNKLGSRADYRPLTAYAGYGMQANLARYARMLAINHMNLHDDSHIKSTLYNFTLNTCETILTMPVGYVAGSILTGLSAFDYSYSYSADSGIYPFPGDVWTCVVNLILYLLCFIPYRIYKRRIRPSRTSRKAKRDFDELHAGNS